MIFVVVTIMVFVAIFSYVVAVFVRLVAISISIARPSFIVSPPVIAVMIVETTVGREALVFPEARIISEARFILASPFPIFPLPFTVEPIVFDIVIPPLCQPLPIIWVVISVVAAVPAVSSIRAVLITVLCASRS